MLKSFISTLCSFLPNLNLRVFVVPLLSNLLEPALRLAPRCALLEKQCSLVGSSEKVPLLRRVSKEFALQGTHRTYPTNSAFGTALAVQVNLVAELSPQILIGFLGHERRSHGESRRRLGCCNFKEAAFMEPRAEGSHLQRLHARPDSLGAGHRPSRRPERASSRLTASRPRLDEAKQEKWLETQESFLSEESMPKAIRHTQGSKSSLKSFSKGLARSTRAGR